MKCCAASDMRCPNQYVAGVKKHVMCGSAHNDHAPQCERDYKVIAKSEKELKPNARGNNICSIEIILLSTPLPTTMLSKQDVSNVPRPNKTRFKASTRKFSPHVRWPIWKHVVKVAIWGDATCSALREALKPPLVNPELKIVFDIYFLPVKIGCEAP